MFQDNSTNYEHPQEITNNPFSDLDKAFKKAFITTPEETAIIKIRRNLGEKAKTFSDEQVLHISYEFQFLINEWLDEYEKDLFNGMTLKEVLNE